MSMSEACQEIISLDKAAREITGKTFFPVNIYCDNLAAVKNTQIEGCHRLKDFDDSFEKIIENLTFREQSGKRKSVEKTHGD